MKKIFLFLTILSFMWAQDDVIIYDYVPLEDVNLSSLDPVQSLKPCHTKEINFKKWCKVMEQEKARKKL